MGTSLLDRLFLNHLKNPNHEYYKDGAPLFDAPDKKSEKSDAGTSSFDAVAYADPSWFNPDDSTVAPSGGTETVSLLPSDSSADLGTFASSASDLNNYDLFADINPAGGTVGLDPPAGSGAPGNIAASGDDLANDDFWALSSDGNSNTGYGDLFASLDPGTNLAGDDTNIFARRRVRRSSRVFRW